MNRNLQKEMKSIADEKFEWCIIMPKNYGKPVLKYTSRKKSSFKTAKYVNNKTIMSNPSQYVMIHSHPVLHWGNIKVLQSFSDKDLINCEADGFMEEYVVDTDLYHRVTAKNWGDRPNEWYEKTFAKIFKDTRDNLRKKVNAQQISLTQYCRTLDELVVSKMCKGLKWDYSTGLLKPSGKSPYDLYNFEIIPPLEVRDIAPWIKKPLWKYYEDRWEKQIKKYPKIADFSGDLKMFYKTEDSIAFDELVYSNE